MPRLRTAFALVSCFIATAAHADSPSRTAPFAIHVVDDQTGRGVPLVYLSTTFKQTYITDSNGYIAFNEPGLMTGGNLWFGVKSAGYESPTLAVDQEGVVLKPVVGGSAEIKLKRLNIAERLYRMTGYGIYRDSVMLGVKPPIKEPLINAQVAGQDTVQTAVYRGRYLWFWQDTDQLAFPLGCFSMTGATTSALPAGVDPDHGIDFKYFVDKPDGFARAMAHVPRKATNPLWLDGLIVTKDKTGRERLIGRYFASNKDFSPAEIGLVIYDDAADRFERLTQFPGDGSSTLAPSGRAYRVREGGKTYVCFVDGVRVDDTFEAASDPARYEAFTCLTTNEPPTKATVDRDAAGKVRWRWQSGAKPLDGKAIGTLIKRGLLKPDEAPEQFKDVVTGKAVRRAGGSIAWNASLNRWTFLFTQKLGDSELGEVWFATANSPQGPWRDAVKVASHAMPHNDNSFYNPIQHEELAKENGRIVYFEGTFVTTFSGNEHPTPYYDYNNLMYRLDLSDPRMKLPDPPEGITHVEPVIEAK